jgi:hypothetical protein
MWLACRAGAGAYDWGCNAQLYLDARLARDVLQQRAALVAAQAVTTGVLLVGLYDYSVDWVEDAAPYDDLDLEYEWELLPADFAAEGHAEKHRLKADVERIELREYGVSWSASVGDDQVETAEITWAALEAVARGENPFAKEEVA